jgi:predicted phage terminase large subunit-like protein
MTNEITTRESAARELLRRQRAQLSLVDYSQAIEIPGAPVSEDPDEWLFTPIETSVAAHHILFLTKIQECIEKPYGRLIIMAPPGSAKSTYAAVVAPTWAMGRFPGYKVLSTSYAAGPAERSARRCQQICSSRRYAGIWDHKVLPKRNSWAVDEWTLTNDSTLRSAGLMGAITSTRMDLGIIDDPVAGREEADSETMRRKTRMAYDDDFLLRLKPSASIIIIMTRWHEDDLVGSILPNNYDGESGPIMCRDGQVWEIICLPAEAERADDPLGRKRGEMLWGEWFTEKHWSIFRGNARGWSAMFQQRPAPETGGQFEKSDFKRYKELPPRISFWLSTDFALTKKAISNRPDFTEHQVWGTNAEADIFLDHGLSLQDQPEETVESGIDLVVHYKPKEWLLEAGGIYNAVNGTINRGMRERSKKLKRPCYTVVEKMPSSEDKVLKASALRIMAKNGKVYVREGPYGDAFIAQCCSFPFGTYDDKVDAGGQMARRVDELYAPEEPETNVRRQSVKPFSAQMAEAVERDAEEDERARRAFRG